jgi:hypothetical protein
MFSRQTRQFLVSLYQALCHLLLEWKISYRNRRQSSFCRSVIWKATIRTWNSWKTTSSSKKTPLCRVSYIHPTFSFQVREIFPIVERRLAVNLHLTPNVTTLMSGYGNIRSYLHRLKIIDSPECPWQSIDSPECPWQSIDSSECPWQSIDSPECPWQSIDSPECPWQSIDSPECPW